MLPVARGANGQPPMPPIEASKATRARLERRVGVGEAGVARVVQVHADRATPSATASARRARDLRGTPTPIVSASTISSGRAGAEPLDELEDAAGVDAALERAAERRGERHRRPATLGVGALDDARRRRRATPRRSRSGCAALNVLRGGEGDVRLVEAGRRASAR